MPAPSRAAADRHRRPPFLASGAAAGSRSAVDREPPAVADARAGPPPTTSTSSTPARCGAARSRFPAPRRCVGRLPALLSRARSLRARHRVDAARRHGDRASEKRLRRSPAPPPGTIADRHGERWRRRGRGTRAPPARSRPLLGVDPAGLLARGRSSAARREAARLPDCAVVRCSRCPPGAPARHRVVDETWRRAACAVVDSGLQRDPTLWRRRAQRRGAAVSVVVTTSTGQLLRGSRAPLSPWWGGWEGGAIASRAARP